MYIHVSTTEPNPTVWLLLNFKNNNVQRANIAIRTLTVCHRSNLNNQSDVWKQSEYLRLHYISGVYIKVLTVTIKPLNQSLKRFKPKYQHCSTLSSSNILNFTCFFFFISNDYKEKHYDLKYPGYYCTYTKLPGLKSVVYVPLFLENLCRKW